MKLLPGFLTRVPGRPPIPNETKQQKRIRRDVLILTFEMILILKIEMKMNKRYLSLSPLVLLVNHFVEDHYVKIIATTSRQFLYLIHFKEIDSVTFTFNRNSSSVPLFWDKNTNNLCEDQTFQYHLTSIDPRVCIEEQNFS